MSNPKVIAQVAAHDAAQRKTADESREEAELQERIARQLKPAPGVPAPAAPVMATPAIAATLQESEQPATVLAPEPSRPATMPDGTPIKRLTREDRLEMALKNLVSKLEEITEHDDWKKVWKTALAAGVEYEGPSWQAEVDFARTLLK